MTALSRQKYNTVYGRWAGVGPYYAMFPASFAERVIKRYTAAGETVLDPFAGRGTVPFIAAALGRRAFGVEIFPVGWVYAAAKCAPAGKTQVVKRLEEIGKKQPKSIETTEFFRCAYSPAVLRFLCCAREHLNWKKNRVDRTLMALILICLHDKKKAGLSNQMRQTKAVHPEYAVRWWRRKRSKPPQIDPVKTLRKKIEWRYAKGIPKLRTASNIYLGDCTRLLSRPSRIRNVRMLFTSPPYYEVTNYFVDQWLRNWMLGGPNRPFSGAHPYMKRFDSKVAYRNLLEHAFKQAARTLRPDAVLFVRTDARKFTFETTKAVLRTVFPKKTMSIYRAPLIDGLSQTALFGDKQKKPGEVDILLR